MYLINRSAAIIRPRQPFVDWANSLEKEENKVDELTLALLFLVTHDRQEGLGARVWKGFDWDTMDRLYEKGFITNPATKAKSVAMTEDGFKKSEDLFRKYFMSK